MLILQQFFGVQIPHTFHCCLLYTKFNKSVSKYFDMRLMFESHDKFKDNLHNNSCPQDYTGRQEGTMHPSRKNLFDS